MVCLSLAECLAEKFGYRNVKELKTYGKSQFSLLDNGILDKPCTRLLLANVGFYIALGGLCVRLITEAGHK